MSETDHSAGVADGRDGIGDITRTLKPRRLTGGG